MFPPWVEETIPACRGRDQILVVFMREVPVFRVRLAAVLAPDFGKFDMNIQVDARPSASLSTNEVLVYLVQAIRARNLRTVVQVRNVYNELFPDMPPERWEHHARALRACLT